MYWLLGDAGRLFSPDMYLLLSIALMNNLSNIFWNYTAKKWDFGITGSTKELRLYKMEIMIIVASYYTQTKKKSH